MILWNLISKASISIEENAFQNAIRKTWVILFIYCDIQSPRNNMAGTADDEYYNI